MSDAGVLVLVSPDWDPTSILDSSVGSCAPKQGSRPRQVPLKTAEKVILGIEQIRTFFSTIVPLSAFLDRVTHCGAVGSATGSGL